MHNGENISEERISAIKSSVLSRVNQSEEDIPMKKHFSVKPLIIAAAVSATAVASIATANAATDGAIINGITKTFTFMLNGHEVEGEIMTYTDSDGNDVAELTISNSDELTTSNSNDELAYGDPVYFEIDEDGNATKVDTPPDLSGLTAGEPVYYEIDENGKATKAEAPTDINGATAGDPIYFEIDEDGNISQVPAPTE